MPGAVNQCHIMPECARTHACMSLAHNKLNEQQASNRCHIGNKCQVPMPDAGNGCHTMPECLGANACMRLAYNKCNAQQERLLTTIAWARRCQCRVPEMDPCHCHAMLECVRAMMKNAWSCRWKMPEIADEITDEIAWSCLKFLAYPWAV